MRLSLPHLPPTGWNSSGTPLARRTQLSYIIVRRPLELWNRMCNRHQVEITVMQFTGHSLPVHQSMSVPWEFFSSTHFISQFPPTRFPLITAIRMCHLLSVHHLGMAFLAGSKGENTTEWYVSAGICFEISQNHSRILFSILANSTICYIVIMISIIFQYRRTLSFQIQKGLLNSGFGPWRYVERNTILKSLF